MSVPVEVGTVIAGKYRVERVLGIGGMGAVVAATHLALHELRAVKLLLPRLANDPRTCERFLREAQAVARLRGEHVARVHDVGTTDGGIPYMVIEYIEGADLAAVRRERGRLPVEDAVLYALQTCEALAEAHRHGIVHRDVKPANLFLTRSNDGSPCIKVLDFGVAKTASKLTGEAVMLGTPRYMPPEQLRSSRDTDARADIWALGVVVYELLTGQKPFEAPSLLQLCEVVLKTAPALPSALRPDLPPGLDEVILRCLAKDREQRYPSIAAFAEALGPFAAEDARSLPARVRRVLGAGDPEPPVEADPTTEVLENAPGLPAAALGAPPETEVLEPAPAQAAAELPLPEAAKSAAPELAASRRRDVTVTATGQGPPSPQALPAPPGLDARPRKRWFLIGAVALGIAGIGLLGAHFWPMGRTGVSDASSAFASASPAAVTGGPTPSQEPSGARSPATSEPGGSAAPTGSGPARTTAGAVPERRAADPIRPTNIASQAHPSLPKATVDPAVHAPQASPPPLPTSRNNF